MRGRVHGGRISAREGRFQLAEMEASSSMRSSTCPSDASKLLRALQERQVQPLAASGRSEWPRGSSPRPTFPSSERCGLAGSARMSTTV